MFSRTAAGAYGFFRPCYVISPEEWAGAPTQQGHTIGERLADPALAAVSLFNYLDARDAAAFVDAWLAAPADVVDGEGFFVGAADALATRPVAELLARLRARHSAMPPTRSMGTRPVFSIDKAAELIGWRPDARLAQRARRGIRHRTTPNRGPHDRTRRTRVRRRAVLPRHAVRSRPAPSTSTCSPSTSSRGCRSRPAASSPRAARASSTRCPAGEAIDVVRTTVAGRRAAGCPSSPAPAGRSATRSSSPAAPPTPAPTACCSCRRTSSRAPPTGSSPGSRPWPRHPTCPSSSTTAAPRATPPTPSPGSPANPKVVGFKDGTGDIGLAQEIVLAAEATGRDLPFFNGLLTAELSQGAYRGIGIPLYSSAAFAMIPEVAALHYRAYTDGDEADPNDAAAPSSTPRSCGCATRPPASASRSSRRACDCADSTSGRCGRRSSTRRPTQERRLGAILDAGLALAERLGGHDGGARGGRTVTASIRGIAHPRHPRAPVAAVGARRARPVARRGRRRGHGRRRGYGFSWTPSIGAAAVQAHLDHDIAAFAIGRDADPESLWEPLWRHLHEGGGGGITTIAMAGLDLALWDLAGAPCRHSASPTTLGRRHETAEVYGSGVNLHYPLDELVAQAGAGSTRGSTP